MNEQIQNDQGKPIQDQELARAMAYAEDPYRELQIHAAQLGLGEIALSMATKADTASSTAHDEYLTQPKSQEQGDLEDAESLTVVCETFGEAERITRELSDTFIDKALQNKLKVGGQKVDIRGYFDKVKPTARDKEIVRDPEKIAGLYLDTTAMLARNLKIAVAKQGDSQKTQELKNVASRAKNMFLENLEAESAQAATEIVDWCDGKGRKYPAGAVEYRGLLVNGEDILDAGSRQQTGVRANIKIQRQFAGTFIMGYSDARVHEKLKGIDKVPGKRIYVNPDLEATPQIFERLLSEANNIGISLQLKMLQRVSEVAEAHRSEKAGRGTVGLRGDGIVLYVHDKDADDVLGLVLALAKDDPSAFNGRKVSRIAQSVADGIGVGDQPTQTTGLSLTSHREQLLAYALERVHKSGRTGDEARELFRRSVKKAAIVNGVNPNNLAFNSSTPVAAAA